MINIKHESDLIKILKAVSAEAVSQSKSKRILESADPSLERYYTQLEQDKGMYGKGITEVEEEESEEEQTPEEEPEEEQEAPPEESEESSDKGVSFDSIVKSINDLRAGKSLRDSSIRQQASDYYDKLSDEERKVLLVYLDALSEIITGQISGKDAQDPGDPPVSIDVTASDSEEEESQQAPPPEPEEDSEPAADEPESEEEDTSPPIKVNESQDYQALRKKVRRLMLRG